MEPWIFFLSETHIHSHSLLHSATAGSSPVKTRSSGIELHWCGWHTVTLEMISAGRGRIVLFPTYILPKGQSKVRHIVRKAVKWAQINA